MQVWIRLGEKEEYQSASSLGAVAQLLDENLVTGPLEAKNHCGQIHGINAPGYHGDNYIVIFWGEDKMPYPDRGLHMSEFDALKQQFDKLNQDRCAKFS